MKITVLRGMAGSGKSTWAKQQTYALIVSRDDIRNALIGTADKKLRLDQKLEAVVTEIEEAAVKAALDAGHDVIIDAMHLKKKYAEKWLYFYPGAEVEYKFFDVSLEDAIARRQGQIPESVLQRQYKLAQKAKQQVLEAPEITKVQQPESNATPAVLFDVDGTLALMGDRDPYDLSRVGEDEVNWPIANILSLFEHHDYPIILLSGRNERAREATEEWLRYNIGWVPELHLRADGDMRPDYVVKREMLEQHVLPYHRVEAVFDDRNSVVNMWRKSGLTCLQVAEGNF